MLTGCSSAAVTMSSTRAWYNSKLGAGSQGPAILAENSIVKPRPRGNGSHASRAQLHMDRLGDHRGLRSSTELAHMMLLFMAARRVNLRRARTAGPIPPATVIHSSRVHVLCLNNEQVREHHSLRSGTVETSVDLEIPPASDWGSMYGRGKSLIESGRSCSLMIGRRRDDSERDGGGAQCCFEVDRKQHSHFSIPSIG